MPDDLNIQPGDIPSKIEEQYEGEWIAWDCAAREVIAHDVQLGKLMPVTNEAYKAGRPIYFHHILPHGAVAIQMVRSLTVEHIRKLVAQFKVSPRLFLD